MDTVAGWDGPGLDHIGELAHRIYAGTPGQVVRIFQSGPDLTGVAICGRFGSAFDLWCVPDDPREPDMLRAAATLTAGLTPDGEILTDVFERDTTRARLLAELGFTPFRIWDDHTTTTIQEHIPSPVLPEHHSLRHADDNDRAALATAHHSAFDEPPTAHLIAPSRTLITVAPDGAIGAFAVYWLDHLNRVGHLEPVGTAARYRRKGLGSAVLLQALREMRALGMATVTVNHDATNEPAAALYRSLGFTRVDRTVGYRLVPEGAAPVAP